MQLQRMTLEEAVIHNPMIAPPDQYKKTLMELAHQIANAASFLDAIKGAHPRQNMRAEADKHVDALHKIAQMLAGNQAEEIYAPDDEEVPA